MADKDIRWLQRFSNLKKAFSKLEEAVDIVTPSQLEKEGLIQRFEYTFELAWNTIKDFYEYQGVSGIQGSRDVIRLAFEKGLVADGETWMKMVDSRIQTTHTYDEEIANEIEEKIRSEYFFLFQELLKSLTEEAKTAIKKL